MAGALATLMLGATPEPFGLVAIESMATGTPVVARRAGALTETVDHGTTGFLVDDLQEAQLAVSRARALDRRRIRVLAPQILGRCHDERVRASLRVRHQRSPAFWAAPGGHGRAKSRDASGTRRELGGTRLTAR
jgi:glycosyltransferase involved in cell wall biosynthesis